MTPTPKPSRLDRYLDTYPGLPAQLRKTIWDRMDGANCSADDPISLQVASDVILQYRLQKHSDLVKGIPAKVNEASKSIEDKLVACNERHLTDARKLVAQDVRCAVEGTLDASFPKLERLHVVRAARVLCSAGLAIAVLAVGAGFFLGHRYAVQHGGEYAALAQEPDAATWRKLQRINGDIDRTLAEHCREGSANYRRSASGLERCGIWLTIEQATEP